MCFCMKEDSKNTMQIESLEELNFAFFKTLILQEDSICVAVITFSFLCYWITIAYFHIYMCGSITNHVKEITAEEHFVIIERRYQTSLFALHRTTYLEKYIVVRGSELLVWLLCYLNLSTHGIMLMRHLFEVNYVEKYHNFHRDIFFLH